MLKVATLFSGVGTPEQSLKYLGIEHETVFACEIDKYARTTYLANNKAPITFYDDVYNIDGNKYKNKIDILIAGKRMGTSCPRGNLIYEYFRIVEESQPKVFIYENVKGFLSIDKGETFKNFVQSFKDLGYTTYHQVLNTKDYLVPQNRERIYIVGFKDNVDFHFQEKQELKLRLKDMLEDYVDEKYLLNQELVSKYLETGTASNHKGSQAGKVADENDETFWTVNAGTHGYSMGYVKLKQTHTLNIKGNDSIKRIYSSDGHNPSLTTMQGGNREPKIAHPVREVGRRLDENGKRCDDNKDIPITRRYEIGEKEISNCLSGVQKDSYVAIANGVIEIENDEVRVKEAVAKGFTLATEGDSINISVPSSKTRRGRVGKQVAQTLDTACNQVVFSKAKTHSAQFKKMKFAAELNLIEPVELPKTHEATAMQIGKSRNFGNNCRKNLAFTLRSSQCNGVIENKEQKYIFRKLTPRECFRLQGFDDNFIFPAKMSSTQLYKQAGNGMSRNILDMIFTQIFTCYTKHIENAKE